MSLCACVCIDGISLSASNVVVCVFIAVCVTWKESVKHRVKEKLKRQTRTKIYYVQQENPIRSRFEVCKRDREFVKLDICACFACRVFYIAHIRNEMLRERVSYRVHNCKASGVSYTQHIQAHRPSHVYASVCKFV